MGHVMVAVPEGHTVQVHPPGMGPGAPAPQPQGMVADPMAMGGQAAMTAALAAPPKKAPAKKKPAEKPKKGATK